MSALRFGGDLMRIERLSESRVKLTVTYEDMEQWGISLENIIDDTDGAKEFFKLLIRKAEVETGFYAENARLMIEAAPDGFDGIDFFVTNLDIQERQNKKTKIRAKAINTKTEPEVFRFETFDDLCDFIKNCPQKDLEGAVYILCEQYYFVTDKKVNTVILEYSRKMSEHIITFSYLKEHGKCIIEKDAAETIKKYFK